MSKSTGNGSYDRGGVTARTSDEPAEDATTITPNDGADLAAVPRAIYIGTGGTLAVITIKSVSLSFTVFDGQILAVACIARVLSTGTSATGLIALF